jgi:hypothetical protein
MRRMDDYMSDNQHMGANKLDSARRDFRASLEAVEAGFGEHAFQRWVPSRRLWRRQVIASLYDAEMFASRRQDPERLRARRDAIEAGLKSLFSNEEFRSAIDAATNTPRLFQTRITMMREMVDSAIAN